MTDTRIYDREEIGKARDNAQNAEFRRHYDKLLNKVRSESKQVNSLRVNLIKAVRGSDMRAINYYQEKISKHGRQRIQN